jgi:type I restriction enzyme S subunit
MNSVYLERLTPLPSGWKAGTVGDYCEVKTGGTPSTEVPSYYHPPEIFWVKSGDVKGRRIQNPPNQISREGMSKSAAKLLPSGSVMIAMSGRGKTRGTTAVLKIEAACSQSVAAMIPRDKLESEFLHYQFVKRYDEVRNITGSDDRSGLNLALIRAIPIALPPVPEQKKIAHILSTVQRAIEAQERIIQTTTELKKALMHKLFTEGLRNEPQKQTEIGPVPESWEVKRFDSFAVLQRGFDITKKDQRPGDYPVVSSGGVSSYHDEPKVKGPGVVIGRKGSLGTVHYIPKDYWPHDTTLWVKDFKGNNPRFVAYLLETMRLKRFDTGAANPTLNRNIVHGEKIAIPPKDQQVEIGEALEAVESKIAIHEGRKRSFEDLFRTLLHELMTAKTRVHDVAV